MIERNEETKNNQSYEFLSLSHFVSLGPKTSLSDSLRALNPFRSHAAAAARPEPEPSSFLIPSTRLAKKGKRKKKKKEKH